MISKINCMLLTNEKTDSELNLYVNFEYMITTGVPQGNRLYENENKMVIGQTRKVTQEGAILLFA